MGQVILRNSKGCGGDSKALYVCSVLRYTLIAFYANPAFGLGDWYVPTAKHNAFGMAARDVEPREGPGPRQAFVECSPRVTLTADISPPVSRPRKSKMLGEMHNKPRPNPKCSSVFMFCYYVDAIAIFVK